MTQTAVVGGPRPESVSSGLAWGFLIVMAVVFGMLRRGTRRLTAVDHPELDERDESARADALLALAVRGG